MKIAMTHVDLPNESKGGVAHSVHNLANALQSLGHEVTMFTYSEKFSECLYEVHTFRRPPLPLRLHVFTFARQLGAFDFSGYDVVHCHGDGYLIGKRFKKIRTFHGSAIDEYINAKSFKRKALQKLVVKLESIDAKRSKVAVGVSENTRMMIPEITEVIANSVDLNRFNPGKKSPHPSLLFVGTVSGRKRGKFLYEIFLREIQPFVPGAELWTVADEPFEGAGIVNFGRIPSEKISELFRQAWVFCLPSTYEGFGIPYIEAMASGTVSVASPNPGAKEVLEDGGRGPIVEDALLGATLRRLLESPAERREWEKKGLERVTFFDSKTIASRYVALYERAARSS